MNSTDTIVRKGYHAFANIIRSLKLTRAKQSVLLAILALCPNGELTTERFPVVVDKIAEYSGYSRAHTFGTLRELEESGALRRDRRRIRLADGTVRNLPTTYTLQLPNTEQKPTAKAPEPRIRVITNQTAQEPVKANVEPAWWEQPVDVDAICASGPSLDEIEVELDTSWDKEPEPAPVEVPKPDPIAAPIAQSPDGFTEEEQDLGDQIVERAQEKLEQHVINPRVSRQVVIAWNAIVAARYTVGRSAVKVCDVYKIGEKEILSCVDEWIAKSVLTNFSPSAEQLSYRLRVFFRDKGNAIARMRRHLVGREVA